MNSLVDTAPEYLHANDTNQHWSKRTLNSLVQRTIFNAMGVSMKIHLEIPH